MRVVNDLTSRDKHITTFSYHNHFFFCFAFCIVSNMTFKFRSSTPIPTTTRPKSLPPSQIMATFAIMSSTSVSTNRSAICRIFHLSPRLSRPWLYYHPLRKPWVKSKHHWSCLQGVYKVKGYHYQLQVNITLSPISSKNCSYAILVVTLYSTFFLLFLDQSFPKSIYGMLYLGKMLPRVSRAILNTRFPSWRFTRWVNIFLTLITREPVYLCLTKHLLNHWTLPCPYLIGNCEHPSECAFPVRHSGKSFAWVTRDRKHSDECYNVPKLENPNPLGRGHSTTTWVEKGSRPRNHKAIWSMVDSICFRDSWDLKGPGCAETQAPISELLR